MGLIFYRPPRQFLFADSFEYSEGWPGTFSTVNPVFTTPIISEGFEYSEGWPGTLNTINDTFTTPIISDGFEFADGWPGTT